MSKYSKEYYERNKEKINARNREHYRKIKDTPEWKAKNRENSRKWREANIERHREIARKWREANPEKYKAYAKKYREKKKKEKLLAERKANGFFAKLKRMFKRGK